MTSDTDSGQKIKIEWDDLKSRKVDQRLKQQEAVDRNRRQAEMNPLAADIDSPSGSIWYNPIFTMAIFGLLGGLLSWGGGEILRFRPDPKLQAKSLMADIGAITSAKTAGRLTVAEADSSIQQIEQEGAGNPYVDIYVDARLTPAQKDAKLHDLDSR